MTDKVLYRCERCGNARLLESFDGLLRFCSDGHEKETMHQVWPSGWISVEDRLPERDHAYLVRIQEDGWEWFDVDDWRGRWYWATESGYESQLTHWMEIPELPEDVRHE